METGPMIEAEGLAKHYGKTRALAGVGFAVPAGTILGLLGPNGAGTTTAVRILTTLALPDAGRAAVAGMDVVKHPGQVRRCIGVAAQDATLDSLLTGRQNLVIVGELSGMGRAAAADGEPGERESVFVAVAGGFNWKFTADDLTAVLRRTSQHEQTASSQQATVPPGRLTTPRWG
jgi:ABC-type branched-subunit amino acid transport system ATPase component